MSQTAEVVGSLYAKTREGFAKLIKEANEYRASHALVAVFPLDGQIAAVYRKRVAGEPAGTFFGEEG